MPKVSLKDQKKELVKETILEVSEKYFIEGGIDAVNIRKIADEIGYSATNIYKYFENKDAIIHQLISRRMAEILRTIEDVDTTGLSTIETLKKRFKAHFHAVLKYGEHYKTVMLSNERLILERTAMLDPNNYTRLPAQNKLIETIKEGIHNQEIKETNPIITAQLIWAGLFGILIRIIIEGFKDKDYIDKLIDTYLEMIFEGLKK